MSQKHKNRPVDKEEAGVSEYAVKRPRHSGLAAIICLILAVAIWTMVMHADDTTYVPLEVCAEDAVAWDCVLSDSTIEIKGKILVLKRAGSVMVDLPDDIVKPGTYALTVENLIFPEGVSPAQVQVLELTVTVSNRSA